MAADIDEFLGTFGGGENPATAAAAIRAYLGLSGITNVLSTTAVLDFPNTAAHDSALLTVTLTGVGDTDTIIVAPSSWFGHVGAYKSAANTVTVEFNNHKATAQNPAARTFRITALQH